MKIMFALFTSVLVLCPSLPALAGPREDVMSATQAWVDAMSSRDVDRVIALYDAEAARSRPRSVTILLPFATTSRVCQACRQSSRASSVSNGSASMARRPLILGPTLFRVFGTASPQACRLVSALSIGIEAGVG